MSADIDISGLQEAQAANAGMIAELKPRGALGRAVQFATQAAHGYAVAVTHRDTSTLATSHRMALDGLVGRISIDSTARNPRSGQLASRYGVYEHERGGDHAFYQRTIDEAGAGIGNRALGMVVFALEHA